ncbi:MAG TPA: enoyl-CoA hydratase/isomerase family protein [Accumulibacter sp.]|uniref:enoyl-CoA hydratase/isomerase family protein n=1 Tax=Accumulibacter sp. TaxID=2053492 RepID=UPI00261A677C|nr:enoyl-CoA hydratase/isomerase family protein [Accumulibacter sp.]MDS4015394.1 enoyl-CoA hydratase/isomerase family protein [Accumulibacter sp.]HMW62580.1 enoyl-CoA hydratase/isomerase family protein [Accumulibacter sp.]HMW79772.1 enoyl-CoA hydratase/isomerase family protein [Accumulibacter sp.]HMX68478.1 enoyl-CoA hydratase/isomerase family protein [Accumulibacter sp.]HNB67224.1 enoyl-CoA hydratase/isomerase family protein [Accumulibacter sp.]
MSEYQSITSEVDGNVGILTLNKGDRHNAFDEQLIAELTDGLREMEADQRVRAVVLSSTGKSFCAGADLEWMRRAAGYSHEENLRDAHRLARLLSTLNELAKPTIARVQGPAYGGGVGLIAACDIALGTYDASFALSEVRLGIVPAVISPYVLAAIGERCSRRYMLTAESFSAAEAYRIGLLHELVPGEEQLDEAIAEILDRLLANSVAAQAECKALIRIVAGQPIDEQTREDTAQCIARVRASPAGREGIAAFLEKRKPHWNGD